MLAVAAHPDDIEFMMAGTLLRLRAVGARLHMWNIANGCCGTAALDKEEISRIRAREARGSARLVGAQWHPPLVDDAFVFYEPSLLARAAALVRTIKPAVLLLPSPDDYMEDHQNAARVMVTAAFVRGMRNFPCQPSAAPWDGELTLYHALPHGLRDGLRRLIRPGQYVDVAPVLDGKKEMLSCHRSQREWLEVSQGMDSYLAEMEGMSAEVGRMSGRFAHAEGWRRHSHLGFGRIDDDPLSTLLGDACWVDPSYEEKLG